MNVALWPGLQGIFCKVKCLLPIRTVLGDIQMAFANVFYFGGGGVRLVFVIGKELASKKIAHTIPLIMTVDETFDVGLDTGTGVDNSYQLPFRFTGTIDKLIFKLGPSQMSAEEQKASADAVAKATD